MMALPNMENIFASLPPGHLPSNVDKAILHAGNEPMPDYASGSKITFHFRTNLQDGDETLVDDSRQMGKPMELFTGKKFKIEIWEAMLKTMTVGEVATFTVPKQFVASYPLLSKTLRDTKRPQGPTPHHCCGMMTKGCGYPDLDKLFDKPIDMKFTFEIIRVERGGEYEKEAWLLTEEEKLDSIPVLKEQGNSKFVNGDVEGAQVIYHEAIARLEQLALKEKPGSEEMLAFEKVKVPLLLNYAFCLMKSEDYYGALEHLNTIIKIEPDNVKGYFRRGICFGKIGDYSKGREDLTKSLDLDKSLKSAVMRELKIIDDFEAIAVEKEKASVKKMFAN